MTDQDFDYIRDLVRRQCALVLENDKRYLVETRLSPLVRKLELSSISDLVTHLRGQSLNVATQVIDAMVTTETSFFRDHHPFASLRQTVLPELLRRRERERQLRIWCAASSSGQEPYSLAMLLRESFPQLATWDVRFIASDVSSEMLARSREGKYSQLEVNRGLPAALLVKYFRQQGVQWQIDEVIRRSIEFREINLAKPWPLLPMLDLVLLRNVMIYFDTEMKKDILARLGRILRPDGFLLLGGAETTFSIDDTYQRVEDIKGGIYTRRESK